MLLIARMRGWTTRGPYRPYLIALVLVLVLAAALIALTWRLPPVSGTPITDAWAADVFLTQDRGLRFEFDPDAASVAGETYLGQCIYREYRVAPWIVWWRLRSPYALVERTMSIPGGNRLQPSGSLKGLAPPIVPFKSEYRLDFGSMLWNAGQIASVLALVVCVPGLILLALDVARARRIARRRAAGLCIACAYPLGTTSTCSECGKAATD